MKNTSIRRTAVALALGGLSVGALAVPSANAADLATWEKLAQCESGGNWSINTGNGFYGGLQFTQQSWNGVGMSGSPHTASRETQIEAGERLLALQGWGAWPACTAKYGLSGAATPTYTNSGAVQSAPAATTSTVVAPQSTVQTPVAPAPATVPAAPAPVAPATVEAPAVSADAASAVAVESAPVSPVVTEAPAPAVAPVKAPVAASSTYQVVAGDTLSLIASRLGVAGGYQAIADANVDVIYDVNLIFPGQVLTIPGS